MAASNVFVKKTFGKLNTVIDAEGNEVEVARREDEEQNVRLSDTIDLLLAAGYFRARIKGLSPFDKVVGGMTWCITICSVDLDIDLLFQENSSIGQKIALTEKIVAVLPIMKCPHAIEPHQIQGLDFIHIFPVVQAIESRSQMGDYIRQYSVAQYHKYFGFLKKDEDKQASEISRQSIQENSYKPKRLYRRSDGSELKEEKLQVQSTLLEFGRKGFMTKSSQKGDAASKDTAESGDRQAAEDDESDSIKTLMSGLSETAEIKVASGAVGSIVQRESASMKDMAAKYSELHDELALEREGQRSGVLQQERTLAALKKQKTAKEKKQNELLEDYKALQAKYEEARSAASVMDASLEKRRAESIQLEELETGENKQLLDKLRSVIAVNESLKSQEKEFKAHCKAEMTRLQELIATAKADGGLDEKDKEKAASIEDQVATEKEKLHKVRLLLARKNRDIAGLRRKIDEVPTRAELSQYQRRFTELYNQMNGTHRETKQFYTLYNTLDETKFYLNKEVNLLNSIHDNFTEAMSSPAMRDAFLKQMDQIVEGVKQNRLLLEKKKQDEKMRRDQLNDVYSELMEKQRLYFKTVKDFTEACRKNEILQARLHTKG